MEQKNTLQDKTPGFSKHVMLPTVVVCFILCLYIGNFHIEYYLGLHPIVNLLFNQYGFNEWVVCILSIAPPVVFLFFVRWMYLVRNTSGMASFSKKKIDFVSSFLGFISVFVSEVLHISNYIHLMNESGRMGQGRDFYTDVLLELNPQLASCETFFEKLQVCISTPEICYVLLEYILLLLGVGLIICVLPALLVRFVLKKFLFRFLNCIPDTVPVVLAIIILFPAVFSIVSYFVCYPVAIIYMLGTLLVLAVIARIFSGEMDIYFFFPF